MEAFFTGLKDCFILEPRVFGDNRGYFFESYNESIFKDKTGLDVSFVQDNQSFSSKGVLRGLHAQAGEFAQAKLVRVIQGEVLDVAVDARAGSETFGQHVAVLLSLKTKGNYLFQGDFYMVLSFCQIQQSFFISAITFIKKKLSGGLYLMIKI